MNTKRRADNPLELAIEAIEARAVSTSSAIAYVEFQHHAHAMARAALAVNLGEYVDHVLKLLVTAGFLRRLHGGPGQLAYVKTTTWSQRDTVLCTLRAPPSHNRDWRLRKQEQARLERARRKEARLEAQRHEREAAKAETRRRRELLRTRLGTGGSSQHPGGVRRTPTPRQVIVQELRA